MRLVDLHAHVLPGVDDGPATIDESIALLRACHRGGARVVVATPHRFQPPFDHRSVPALEEIFEQTVARLAALAGSRPECAFLAEVELLLGSENLLTPEFLAALDSGDVLPLGGGRSLLVEFGPYLPGDSVRRACERILACGYFPVLAHVERYELFRREPGRLAALVELGCVAQVNAASLLQARFSAPRRAAWSFLRRGLAMVVASDAHDAGRRGPVLGEARARLVSRFGSARATAWLSEVPARLVAGSR